MLSKLVLTALLSLSVGVAGTYAAIHVAATCAATPEGDGGIAAFLSRPDLPLTGPRYK